MTATLPATAPAEAAVRPAVRHRRPGWRDPRILVGVLIVAASVLAGAKVLAAADDTVAVWAVRRDLPAGTRVDTGDLQAVRMRFTSDAEADRYLAAADAVPGSAVLTRPVGAGELLPRAALTTAAAALVEVPVSVAVDDVPSTVRPGSVVDVWVTPQSATAATKLSSAVRVLDDVVVVRLPPAADSLSPDGTRQVIVGVTTEQSDQLGDVLGRLASGRTVLTRQG